MEFKILWLVIKRVVIGHINRITVEFKSVCWINLINTSWNINRITVEFKIAHQKPIDIGVFDINRITVEFKIWSKGNPLPGEEPILIESQWNLKKQPTFCTLMTVWNINRITVEFKIFQTAVISSRWLNINRITVEFKTD